jgi:PAS domain S-box-containing protein
VPQQNDLCSAVEAKLEMAEKALSYSNDNIQLTMQIWIQASNEVERLLAKRADNSAEIAKLIQELRERIQSEKEKQLLDAASPRWGFTSDYGELLHHVADGQSRVEAGAAMASVMLPLLLDNASWKLFVEFLRTELEHIKLRDNAFPEEIKEGMIRRTREMVRQNQVLKTTVAERKRLEERLAQLTSIIECANDAIVIYTLGGTIVSWNKGAESVYGYPASEVLGRSRYMLLPPEQAGEGPGILEELKREERIGLCETVHLHKGGKRIGVSMSVSPVKDMSGTIVGFAAITRKISDGKEASPSGSKREDGQPSNARAPRR